MEIYPKRIHQLLAAEALHVKQYKEMRDPAKFLHLEYAKDARALIDREYWPMGGGLQLVRAG